VQKVAILGLAGDPPHNGHKAVMELASRYVDEVWLMPCYLHKFKSPIALPEDRLTMCKLVGKTSDYEISHKSFGYTYDNLVNLKRDFPQCEFSLVIGQDNANLIHTWNKYELLIKSVRFIVISRGKSGVLNDWYLHNDHIFVKTSFLMFDSSSEIRNWIKNKQYTEAAHYLEPSVLQYIKDKELYV
jgi:nicotinate-nucleotide adenylyltransferase